MLKLYKVHQDVVTTPIRILKSNPSLELRGGAVAATDAAASTVEPLLQKFISGPHGYAHIVLAIILSTLLKPAAKIYYENFSYILEKLRDGDGDGDGVVATNSVQERPPLKGTKFFKIVKTIAEAAKLLLIVVVFDFLKITILHFGIKIPKSENLTDVFGCGIYLLWGFRKISAFKLYLLKKTMHAKDLRRAHLINNLSDYALLFFVIFVFYEILNVEMGYSAKSLLGLLSLFTAAIALATKDIITNFLNGVILSASDRIYVGDFISIHGDVKKVDRLGWLETVLKGSDNVSYTVPNTELLSTKLSNLSRVGTCQVHQTLKFPLDAMEKLPKLTEDIKNEIRSACPSVIADGSHPFQCYWINFKSGELEVFINAHFRIPPVGDVYYENRQNCLMAINRAIRKNEIEKYSGA